MHMHAFGNTLANSTFLPLTIFAVEAKSKKCTSGGSRIMIDKWSSAKIISRVSKTKIKFKIYNLNVLFFVVDENTFKVEIF